MDPVTLSQRPLAYTRTRRKSMPSRSPAFVLSATADHDVFTQRAGVVFCLPFPAELQHILSSPTTKRLDPSDSNATHNVLPGDKKRETRADQALLNDNADVFRLKWILPASPPASAQSITTQATLAHLLPQQQLARARRHSHAAVFTSPHPPSVSLSPLTKPRSTKQRRTKDLALRSQHRGQKSAVAPPLFSNDSGSDHSDVDPSNHIPQHGRRHRHRSLRHEQQSMLNDTVDESLLLMGLHSSLPSPTPSPLFLNATSSTTNTATTDHDATIPSTTSVAIIDNTDTIHDRSWQISHTRPRCVSSPAVTHLLSSSTISSSIPLVKRKRVHSTPSTHYTRSKTSNSTDDEEYSDGNYRSSTISTTTTTVKRQRRRRNHYNYHDQFTSRSGLIDLAPGSALISSSPMLSSISSSFSSPNPSSPSSAASLSSSYHSSSPDRPFLTRQSTPTSLPLSSQLSFSPSSSSTTPTKKHYRTTSTLSRSNTIPPSNSTPTTPTKSRTKTCMSCGTTRSAQQTWRTGWHVHSPTSSSRTSSISFAPGSVLGPGGEVILCNQCGLRHNRNGKVHCKSCAYIPTKSELAISSLSPPHSSTTHHGHHSDAKSEISRPVCQRCSTPYGSSQPVSHSTNLFTQNDTITSKSLSPPELTSSPISTLLPHT